MQRNLVLRVLSSSVSVSEKAGAIIRDIIKTGNLGIVDKGFNDLQTEADRNSQKCIIKSLSTQFPKISIIGEENLEPNHHVPPEWIINKLDETVLNHKCPEEYHNVRDEDLVVWVDPLDGTSEFTQGFLDHVTVLIGLSINGRAIGGVIHQPFFNLNTSTPGRTIWGLVGLGAFGIEKKEPPPDKLIITTTRSHSNEIINRSVEAMSPDQVIRVGGAGNKVLYVIEGKCHAYVFASRGCKKWDTCAPEGVLHALGGRLTDILGQPLTYRIDENFTNELGVLATYCQKRHEHYCNLIPNDIKEYLVKKSKQLFKCF